MNLQMLISTLESDESFVPYVYDDATGEPITKGSVVQGFPTIGYGQPGYDARA